MRKWRLLRARELGIETYKIFQNRTLCEMIRRRRDDKSWARGGDVSAVPNNAASATSSETETESTLVDVIPEYTSDVARDLADCWGVGPGKVKEGGFAWEALAVLNRPALEALLDNARAAIETKEEKPQENMEE